MHDLRDKVVAITGAAGGIGRALCLALAARGCKVGLLSRTPEKLGKLAVELQPTGVATCVQVVDMRDRAAVLSAFAVVERTLGPVDVLIHNAGVARLTDARAPDLNDLEEMLGVNYLGGVYALEALLPGMMKRGQGQIAAISSLGAWRALAWCAGYSASKKAFATYLESLRPALRLRGVRVSTIFPGFVRTAMSESFPMRFPVLMLSPEGAAKRIIRAITKERREAAFPFHEATIMRLFQRLPAWLYDPLMVAAGRWGMKGEY